MADRIKGITVEIGGDTTGLSKALSGVNKEIRNTQSQLTDVNRLLKLLPIPSCSRKNRNSCHRQSARQKRNSRS